MAASVDALPSGEVEDPWKEVFALFDILSCPESQKDALTQQNKRKQLNKTKRDESDDLLNFCHTVKDQSEKGGEEVWVVEEDEKDRVCKCFFADFTRIWSDIIIQCSVA